MSVERLKRTLVCLLLLLPQSVFAWQAIELDTPWRDPLLTAPKELAAGVALPGDSQPASCPVFKDFSTPLALAEAVDLALCNNAQVKAAWADIKARAAAVGVARAAYLPTLSASVSYRNDTTRFSDDRMPAQKITAAPLNGLLSWRLFDFAGRGASHDAAKHNLAAALASHNAQMQQTLATVVQGYFDTQVTRAAWRTKSLSEEIARNTLEAAKRREAKGAGTSGDRLQAATALAKATLDMNRAEGAYRKALSVLLYGIGLSEQTRVSLTDDLDEFSGEPSSTPSGKPSSKPSEQTPGQALGQLPGGAAQDLDEWLREAQRLHPAVIAARERLAAARYQVTATRSEGWPVLNFSAGYYANGRMEQSATAVNSDETVIGATLTFPLFDGFGHTYKVRAAEAEVERQAAGLRDSEQRILMEMVKAHADAVATLGNLDAANHLLATAQEALRAAQRRYEKGAADILEILNTQNAFFEAQQERLRTLAEWRAAKLQLLAAAGALNRTEITR